MKGIISMLKTNKKIYFSIFLFAWTLFIVIGTGYFCKKSLHFDELFSYGSANTSYNYETMVGDREWKNPQEMFLDYLSVAPQERFDYKMVWANQASDVHPPLYYAIVHTICSIAPETFSIWVGISINLFFLLLTLPALFLISKKIIDNDKLAFTICFCFITSNLTMGITMFLRMYVMLICMAAWTVYIHLKWLENTVKYQYLCAILFLALCGALTHYYYLVFLFFFAIASCIILITRKNKDIIKYIISMMLSGLAFVKIYPASLEHIFHGYRGDEAFSNIKTLENYSSIILNYLRQIGNGITNNSNGFFIILIIILVAISLHYIMRKKNPVKQNDKKCCFQYQYYLMLLFTCTCYFFVIVKISTIQDARYVSPIYPMLYLLILDIIYISLNEWIKIDIALTAMILGSLILFNWRGWTTDHVPEPTKIAQKYTEYDCLIMAGDPDWTRAYFALNNYYQLINFEQLYFVSLPYEDNFENQQLANEKELIVYIDEDDNTDYVENLLLDLLPQFQTVDFQYEASGCKAYLFH